MGRVTADLLSFDASTKHYNDALSILDQMIANGENVHQAEQSREVVTNELREVELAASRAREALGAWEEFISRPGARSRLAQRISLLAREGRFDEIPQSAEMLRSLDSENPDNLYNAACGYALCANAIQPADGAELTSEAQAQREGYIELALACLRESIVAGYSDFEHMQQDPDLAVLRGLPEFEGLLPEPAVPALTE
jgi:hypothetical protein